MKIKLHHLYATLERLALFTLNFQLSNRGQKTTKKNNVHIGYILVFTAAVLLAMTQRAQAQANVPIYAISTSDVLVNGFEDYSYNATVNYANTSPRYAGSTYSISVSAYNYGYLWPACNLGNNNLGNNYLGFNTTPYASLSFWINGGPSGGQSVAVLGMVLDANGDGNSQGSFPLPALTANTWTHYTIPLSTLGVANMASCNGFAFQIQETGSAPTFYVDEIQLVPVAAPATTPIAVNAGQTVRTADARWLGMNTAVWDGDFDTAETVLQLTEGGCQILRYPGGSEADYYRWDINTILDGPPYSDPTDQAGQAGTSPFPLFAQTAASLGSQVMITVNYGSGTPQEAAAWVAYANATPSSTVSLGVDEYNVNWKTAGYWASLRAAAPLATDDGYNFLRVSQTAPFGVKYWELGNELYGYWETDDNADPNSPSEYATRAKAYFSLMKTVDSTIKCGVDVEVGEDNDANGYTIPAVNKSTGVTHYGWTPVLLSTMKSLNATPDFLSYHWYPEDGNDNDWILLQGTSIWTTDAANLRSMINNYFGTAPNIELLCTENNNDPGYPSPPSKQSVSLVNALYYADSLGQLMQTEFNSFLWWDFRNYQDNAGDDTDPTLYGWRAYGDLGMMNGQATDLPDRYPTFFSAQLLANFVGGGDSVLTTTSGCDLLSAYAVERTSGNLTLLVINKDPSTTFSTQIALSDFTPNASATVYSYGIPQDNAAAAGNAASCGVAQTTFSSAAATFNYSFAPYSLTLFVFTPAAPVVSAFTTLASGNNLDYPSGGVVLSGSTLYGTTTYGGSSGAGALFCVSTSGAGFSILHSFNDNTDGMMPSGLYLSGSTIYGVAQLGSGTLGPDDLDQGKIFSYSINGTGYARVFSFGYDAGDGTASYPSGVILSGSTLYGTAQYRGSYYNGALFSVNINGTGYNNFYNFTGGSDGSDPTGNLVLSGNTLYGTASSGGSGNGTVFKVNTDGTSFTVLHEFGGSDGSTPNGGMVISGGTLYGTTASGGNRGDGTIFAVNTNGTSFNSLYSFTGSSDGVTPNGGLIIADGTLFGTASGGGSWGNGTIFSFNLNGTGFNNLYSFTGGSDGAMPNGSLIIAGNTLYGTASTGTVYSFALTPQAAAQATAPAGQTATVVLPTTAAQGGLSATLHNNSGSAASIAALTYDANPAPGGGAGFGLGTTYLDLDATGATSADSMTAYFYYPASDNPAPTLEYYTGSQWETVMSSGPSTPVVNTALDRITVVFNQSSIPPITQLTGTMFALATPAVPSLVVALSSNSVIISWPNTGTYTLQQNTNLATTNWTASGYAITTNSPAGTNSITITRPAGNLFFRLSNP